MKALLVKLLKYLWLAVDKKKIYDWFKKFIDDTLKKRLNRSDIAAVGLGAASLTMVADTATKVEAIDKKVDPITRCVEVNDSTGVISINGIEIEGMVNFE